MTGGRKTILFPAMSLGRTYLDRLLTAAEQSANAIPHMVAAAERGAQRLVAGGRLYAASVRPDFVSEAYIRSGGLMMLQACDDGQKVCGSDVVIVGWSGDSRGASLDLVKRLGGTHALVIGIGPPREELSSLVDACIGNDVQVPASLTGVFGVSYPVVSVHNLVLLWAFTGELIAALTRLGQMPAVYQSVLVPGARARNDGLVTRRFHERHAVPPIEADELGTAYLSEIAGCLRTVRDRQIEAVEQIADTCAEVIHRGNRIQAFLISHFPWHQAGAPGDPGFMHRLAIVHGETPDLAELEEVLQPGDLFLFLGYYRRPVAAYEVARRRQCRIVEVITGTDDADPAGALPDYIIRPGWRYTDALVAVPGYDICVLPASGIMQTAIYWAIVAEIATRVSPG